MTTTLKQAQPKTAKDDIYAEETTMTSIVSYPKRCHFWGNARFRGNCDGRLFKNLVLRYRPTRVADPMMGSGTTEDVIAGLNHTGRHNIHYWGADLRTGFDLRTDPLPGPFDFIWLHPPYWNIIRYSDDDPRDLSTFRTYEEFSDGLRRCLRRCYESLLREGRLAILLGDVRRKGAYFPIVRDVLAMEGTLGQLRSVALSTSSCLLRSCSIFASTIFPTRIGSLPSDRPGRNSHAFWSNMPQAAIDFSTSSKRSGQSIHTRGLIQWRLSPTPKHSPAEKPTLRML